MRPPPPDDIRLWRRAMREVTPLPGRNLPQDRGPTADRRHPAGIAAGTGAVRATAPPQPTPSPPLLNHFAGIDRANAERLKRGRRPIEATLDLHGMTQIEAH